MNLIWQNTGCMCCFFLHLQSKNILSPLQKMQQQPGFPRNSVSSLLCRGERTISAQSIITLLAVIKKKGPSQIKPSGPAKSLSSLPSCWLQDSARCRQKRHKGHYLVVFPVSVHHPVLPIGADLQLVGTDIVALLGFSRDGTLCGNGCEHSQEVEVHLSRGKRDKK